MQCILNYYKTAKQHGIKESAINLDFNQMYTGKLSRDQKKSLIDQKIETCMHFIAKIKDNQRTNLQFLHTTRTTQGVKTFQYVNRPGERGGCEPDPPAAKQPAHDSRNQSGSGPRWPDGRANGTLRGRRNVKCFLCQEKHFLYNCPILTLEPDPAKVKTTVQEKMCLIFTEL